MPARVLENIKNSCTGKRRQKDPVFVSTNVYRKAWHEWSKMSRFFVDVWIWSIFSDLKRLLSSAVSIRLLSCWYDTSVDATQSATTQTLIIGPKSVNKNRVFLPTFPGAWIFKDLKSPCWHEGSTTPLFENIAILPSNLTFQIHMVS